MYRAAKKFIAILLFSWSLIIFINSAVIAQDSQEGYVAPQLCPVPTPLKTPGVAVNNPNQVSTTRTAKMGDLVYVQVAGLRAAMEALVC
jgi:hypothetical protein